ncbi:hypothetical protein [Gluconacetobacter diazotrophicus]|uniref:hypothetical protein n=1 Tax=Gluconacetobacter diazotrophicus TaxID=33996 RepID=UPI0012FF20EA|nr:hypothetical protein [Gluconacetobacter diazotrophicus]
MSSSPVPASDNLSPPSENRLYPELFALHREIHDFSKDLENFSRLLKIQRRIISSIEEAENEIRDAKIYGKNPKDWQYVRYNFLCLGDCLAFLYVDRFSLKQTYFDTNTYNIKQSGGFILGKDGHKNEMMALENAISHNIPAVLCDITNVLRYGDICLLGDSDPVPIEVKSSKTKDRRSKRQKLKLQTLSDFLKSDHAENFRGVSGSTIRVECSTSPKLYNRELQDAVKEAIKRGSVSFEVDECLRVVIISEDNVDYAKLFGEKNLLSKSLITSVNEIKTNMLWGCYYPYPLTFSDPASFEAFVRGEIHIFTILYLEKFEEKLASEHVTLNVEASEYKIECHMHFPDLVIEDPTARFTIGEHMMCRIWTDFISPRWIVDNSILSVRNAIGKRRA